MCAASNPFSTPENSLQSPEIHRDSDDSDNELMSHYQDIFKQWQDIKENAGEPVPTMDDLLKKLSEIAAILLYILQLATGEESMDLDLEKDASGEEDMDVDSAGGSTTEEEEMER